jgi:hypothetical protein
VTRDRDLRDPDYRSPAESSSDAVAAAMVDLGRRMARLRLMVLAPGAALAMVSALCGATLHVFGHWSVIPAFDDGSYFVAAPTLAIALLLPGALVLAPFVVLHRCLRARARQAWVEDSSRRLGVDRAELRDLSGMFG